MNRKFIYIVISISLMIISSVYGENTKCGELAYKMINDYMSGNKTTLLNNVADESYKNSFEKALTGLFSSISSNNLKIKKQFALPAPGLKNERWIVEVEGNNVLMDILLVFNNYGKLVGMFFYPGETAEQLKIPFADYKLKTKLKLPVKGKWAVAQGGMTFAENHHLVDYKSRCGNAFAIDLIKINSQNGLYKNNGKNLVDYYSYGEDVIAPADGTVIEAVDGIIDSNIGQADLLHMAGNTIVIKHGKDEFSLFAHLKNGSIIVKAGQKIKAGEIIAKVGNSGSDGKSFPHLHFQMQNGEQGCNDDGLPIIFSDIYVNGIKTDSTSVKLNDIAQNE